MNCYSLLAPQHSDCYGWHNLGTCPGGTCPLEEALKLLLFLVMSCASKSMQILFLSLLLAILQTIKSIYKYDTNY